jgi:Arc/MetJ-type ribon-helix-helix transcriptional regulator
MGKDSTANALVTLVVKVPACLDEAIQRLHNAEIGKGLMPSRSDVIRQLLVNALKAEGYEVQPVSVDESAA